MNEIMPVRVEFLLIQLGNRNRKTWFVLKANNFDYVTVVHEKFFIFFLRTVKRQVQKSDRINSDRDRIASTLVRVGSTKISTI